MVGFLYFEAAVCWGLLIQVLMYLCHSAWCVLAGLPLAEAGSRAVTAYHPPSGQVTLVRNCSLHVTLSHSHIVKLAHSLKVKLSHSHTDTLWYCLTVLHSHCSTVTLSNFPTLKLTHFLCSPSLA